MTRPKEIAPFHMLRMDPAYPIRPGPDTTSVAWMLLLGDMFDLPIRQGGPRELQGRGAAWTEERVTSTPEGRGTAWTEERGTSTPAGRGTAWTEERRTSDEGRRRLRAPWRPAGDRARATREGGAAKAPRRRAGDTS